MSDPSLPMPVEIEQAKEALIKELIASVRDWRLYGQIDDPDVLHAIDALIAAVSHVTEQQIATQRAQEDGAALLPADPSAPVQTEPLPINQALEALEFAAAAIIDAIADDDGLDAKAGTVVLRMIDDALVANGRHEHPKPTDENYRQYYSECSLTAMLFRMTREALQIGSGNQATPENSDTTRRSAAPKSS